MHGKNCYCLTCANEAYENYVNEPIEIAFEEWFDKEMSDDGFMYMEDEDQEIIDYKSGFRCGVVRFKDGKAIVEWDVEWGPEHE